MAFRDTLLANEGWYSRWKVMIRADKAMSTIAEHIGAGPGDKVLDVGCGNGDVRPKLADADYTGVDLNDDYLAKARATHNGPNTQFIRADVAELEALGLGPYDVACGIGVLHHLSDAEVASLLGGIADALRPGGRLVTMDPVFDPEQRTTARVLAALDRGRYVRDRPGYERLVGGALSIDSVTIRHDLLAMPYSHCIIESHKPVAAG